MKYLMESTLLTLLLTMPVPDQSPNPAKASDVNLPPAPAMKVKVQDDSPLKVVGWTKWESVQWLAGMRTGGNIFAGRLLKILYDIGPAAVVKCAEAAASELQIPPHESQAWRTGFSNGVQGILQRLKDAFQDGGLPDIEPALKRPVDASGYQIEVVKPENP